MFPSMTDRQYRLAELRFESARYTVYPEFVTEEQRTKALGGPYTFLVQFPSTWKYVMTVAEYGHKLVDEACSDDRSPGAKNYAHEMYGLRGLGYFEMSVFEHWVLALKGKEFENARHVLKLLGDLVSPPIVVKERRADEGWTQVRTTRFRFGFFDSNAAIKAWDDAHCNAYARWVGRAWWPFVGQGAK